MLKKLCIATLLALPAAVMAEGLSYNFVEGNLLVLDGDGGSLDGFGVGASFLVAPQFFLTSSYARLTDPGVSLRTFSGGAGFRHPLSPKVDFTGNASVVFAKAKVDGLGSGDDTGYSVGAGLRALLAPQFELNGGASYTDIADNGELGFNLGAVFSFTPQFALVGGVAVGDDFGDDFRLFNIGGRFMF